MPDPLLTLADVAALCAAHDPLLLAWLLYPAPNGNGLLARPHTLSHTGGELLPGHVLADDLDAVRRLVRCERAELMPPIGVPADCIGLAW